MKTSLCLLVCIPVLLAGGCATGPSVTRTEPGGPGGVTTAGIDIADFKAVAGKMVESMLAQEPSPFARIQGRKARIRVDHIKNDTTQYFHVSQIHFKITTDLMKSGKTETDTTSGPMPVNPIAGDDVAIGDFEKDTKKVRRPDFGLSGTILETVARAGNKREFSYTLQLFLTDGVTGAAVWQDEQIVSKQTNKKSVGF